MCKTYDTHGGGNNSVGSSVPRQPLRQQFCHLRTCSFWWQGRPQWLRGTPSGAAAVALSAVSEATCLSTCNYFNLAHVLVVCRVVSVAAHVLDGGSNSVGSNLSFQSLHFQCSHLRAYSFATILVIGRGDPSGLGQNLGSGGLGESHRRQSLCLVE